MTRIPNLPNLGRDDVDSAEDYYVVRDGNANTDKRTPAGSAGGRDVGTGADQVPTNSTVASTVETAVDNGAWVFEQPATYVDADTLTTDTTVTDKKGDYVLRQGRRILFLLESSGTYHRGIVQSVASRSSSANVTIASGTDLANEDITIWARLDALEDNAVNFHDFDLGSSGDQSPVIQAAIDYAISTGARIKHTDSGTIEVQSGLDCNGASSESLSIELGPDTIIQLTASASYLLLTKNIGKVFIKGGTWDTNNQISLGGGNIGVGFDTSLGSAGDTHPGEFVLEGAYLLGQVGNGNTGSNSTRGLVTLAGDYTGAQSLIARIRDNVFDNQSNSQGSGLIIEADKFENSIAFVERNAFRNVYQGVRVRNVKHVEISKNKVSSCIHRGLLAYGIISTSEDPVITDAVVSVNKNSVSLDASQYNDNGILFGYNAGVVNCSDNSVYLDSTTYGNGINSDAVLSSGDVNVRPSSIIQNNTVHGALWSYYCNDSYAMFVSNRAFEPGEYALHMSQGSKRSVLIDGNYFQGSNAKIAFRPSQSQGDSPGVYQSPILGNNSFVDVVGSHIVRSENSGLLVASRPRTVSTDLINEGNGNIAGVHADIYELDTSSGAISTELPFAGLLPSGTRFRACIKAGSNSATFNPFFKTFDDADVNTTDNSILFSFTYAQQRVTGTPIRFQARGGTLPAPLNEYEVYYVITGPDKGLSTDKILLASSYNNAVAGTEISLTSSGDATTKRCYDVLFSKGGTAQDTISISSQGEMIDLVSGPACWWVV